MQNSPLSDLDAILLEARRQRAAELHRLARVAVAALARLFQRAAPSRSQ